jgi:tRNA threonylcarbamoyladenosine biosynthesis protein TsaE
VSVPWQLRVTSASAAVTRDLAAGLAQACRPGDVVLLEGDLGAGKTAFAQGFARGLGVGGPVTSPTFTLVRQYWGGDGQVLVHADLYRIETVDEVADLGLAELVDEGAMAVVEWGEVAGPELSGAALVVRLERVAGGDDDGPDEERQIAVEGRGARWAARRDEVEAALVAAAGPPVALR